jgi:hypothetical protein
MKNYIIAAFVLVVAIFGGLAIYGRSKSWAAVPTEPLTYQETKDWLDTFDAAKASQDVATPYEDTARDNLNAWMSVTRQMNEAHKLVPEQGYQIVKRNCQISWLFGSHCDRTVIKAPLPPKATTPTPDTSQTKPQEPPKK